MGKSTVAAQFRRAHIRVFDADREVHRLQGPGGAAVQAIGAAFPGVLTGYPPRVDRSGLRAIVLADPAALHRLEGILHPAVRLAQARFLRHARAARQHLVVLDIPLLFETGGARRTGAVMVVSAPPSVQRARVRARRRMTNAQIDVIIAKQWPDRERRRRADVVIQTGLSRRHAYIKVRRFLLTAKDRR